MRKILLVVSTLLLVHCISNAQKLIPTKAKISGVDFSILEDRVYIKYAIISAKKGDLFNVKVKAFNDFGEEIMMTALTGDIDTVTPGLNKYVVWNMGKDLYQIDDKIFIEVSAELITPKILQPIKKSQAYLYSTLFPGLGTYKLSAKKYHLTKGVVSYGLIAASIYNGLKASSYYDDYLIALDQNERNTLYNNSKEKQQLAQLFAISAGSIWLLEYLNIYLAKNKVLKSNMELGVNVDQNSKYPSLSLNFKF